MGKQQSRKRNFFALQAPLSRRRFLQRLGWVGGSSAALPLLSACGSGGGGSSARVGREPGSTGTGMDNGGNGGMPGAARTVFVHGVASGDPLADRVILWSHVTPAAGTTGPVAVQWDIASDPGMNNIVANGNALADPARDFTVKVDATGLQPGTTYYYRFSALNELSPIGRTRTLPVGTVDQLRVAVVSCSSYPHGFFNAYRRVAERADLDVVLHLGDYIYEYPGRGVSAEENPDEYGDGRPLNRAPEPPHEIVTLEDYRTRHAFYKLDADLQELHRQHPMICVWDDHETTNNSFMDGAQNHNPDRGEGEWEPRENVAIQAYFEWLPIRQVDANDNERIFRSFAFGNLADLFMLDTRLMGRVEELEATIAVPGSPANVFTDSGEFADDRPLLDDAQRQWLQSGMTNSPATWKLLGQQVMFGQLKFMGAPNSSNLQNQGGQGGQFLNPDQWDGYPRDRERLWDTIRGGQSAPNVAVDNVVVLTGDIHTSWAMDITEDPNNALAYNPQTGEGAMAVEFVTTSVTSPGLDELAGVGEPGLMTQNPHMKYIELAEHGYLLLDITPARIQAEWWFVDDIETAADGESMATSFAVAAGENRLSAGGAETTSQQPERAPAPAEQPAERTA